MELSERIWRYLEAPSPEDEDRRGAILDRLLRAFKDGREDAAVAELDSQMKALEDDFDETLAKLEGLLGRSPTP